MNIIEERKSRLQRKKKLSLFTCDRLLVDIEHDLKPHCGLGETLDEGNTHEMQLIFIKNTSIVLITWSTKHTRKG